MYRPPDSGRDFWSQLQCITEPFVGRRLILLGDFNVDVLNPSDQNDPHLQTICSLHSLVNHVGSPTRLSATASKCINLILGNFSELSSATVRHVDFTDHALIYSSINTVKENRQQTTKITRRMWASKTKNSCTAADFLNALQYHMQSLPTNVDVEYMWKEWKYRFHAALDEAAPRVTTTRNYGGMDTKDNNSPQLRDKINFPEDRFARNIL